VQPTLPVSAEGKVLQISSATSLALTPQAGPTHFSISANAEAQGVAVVNYAAKMPGVKAVAILSDDGGQSKTAVVVINKRIEELNLKLAGTQEFHFRTEDMTPQLLSLRRSQPDAVLFVASAPEDSTKLLQTLRDIGWDPPIVSFAAIATYGPTIVKATGADAFKNVLSLNYLGFTYCSNDKVGENPYATFRKGVAAFDPDLAKTVSLVSSVYFHDSLQVMRAAMDGAKSTDGPTLAAWLEEHGSSVKNLIMGPPSPSKASHFLLGPDSLVMVVRPDQMREDSLQKRAGC
jgi:ABC-type branched-subunit amino acid transport system substrate-binding protein